MLVLDENISAGEERKLSRWRLRCRVVGVHFASKGAGDPDFIPLLLRLPRPTFITADRDFWRARLCHSGYAIAVVADLAENEVAVHVRRFLAHPQFDTAGKRLGRIVRLRPESIGVFNAPNARVVSVPWNRAG